MPAHGYRNQREEALWAITHQGQRFSGVASQSRREGFCRMSESQLRRLIAERSQAAADETFVEDARSDRRVTYRQLEGSVRAWSRTLDAAEVTADANVLLDVSDPVAFAVALLGVIASGRCAVPTDPSAPDGEKARLAAAVGAALTISDGATPTAMPVGLDGYPTAGAGPALSGSGGAGRLRLHTSGSTGEPKAVELTEAQLLHVAGQVADHNALVPADRGYNSLPAVPHQRRGRRPSWPRSSPGARSCSIASSSAAGSGSS